MPLRDAKVVAIGQGVVGEEGQRTADPPRVSRTHRVRIGRVSCEEVQIPSALSRKGRCRCSSNVACYLLALRREGAVYIEHYDRGQGWRRNVPNVGSGFRPCPRPPSTTLALTTASRTAPHLCASHGGMQGCGSILVSPVVAAAAR